MSQEDNANQRIANGLTREKNTSERIVEILTSYIEDSFYYADGKRVKPKSQGKFTVDFLSSDNWGYPGEAREIFAKGFSYNPDAPPYRGYEEIAEDMNESVTEWLDDQGATEVLQLTESCETGGFSVCLFHHPSDPEALYCVETPFIYHNSVQDSPVDVNKFSFYRYGNVSPDLSCENARAAANLTVMRALDLSVITFPRGAALVSRDALFRQLLIQEYTDKLIDIEKLTSHARKQIDRKTYDRMREISLLTAQPEQEIKLTVDLDHDSVLIATLRQHPGIALIKVTCDINTINPQQSIIHLHLADGNLIGIDYNRLLSGLGSRHPDGDEKSSALYRLTESIFASRMGPDGFLVDCIAQKVMTGSNNVTVTYQADNHPDLVPEVLRNNKMTPKP